MAEGNAGLTWVRDEGPVWDADKARIIGGAPEGAFVVAFADAEALPGEWWSARDADGAVVGYGRLDTTWGGDAEILLAVDPDRQGSGVGTFILDMLDQEAAARGINYIRNRIREHEQRDLVHDWLIVRGFRGPVSGDLSKRVGTTHRTPSSEPSTPPSQPAPPRHEVQLRHEVQPDPADRAPGHEEQGGYVDVDEHRY